MRFRPMTGLRCLMLILEITLVLAPGLAAASEGPRLSPQDRQFLYWASDSGMADAALSRLASHKAQDAAVKAFAQHALGTYEHAAAQLRALASENGVSPPRQVDKDEHDLHDNLAATSGADFDHLFLRTLIGDTRKMITLYDQEAVTGENTAILGFVAITQPSLRQLDDAARRIDLTLPETAPLMSPSGTIATRQPTPGPM